MEENVVATKLENHLIHNSNYFRARREIERERIKVFVWLQKKNHQTTEWCTMRHNLITNTGKISLKRDREQKKTKKFIIETCECAIIFVKLSVKLYIHDFVWICFCCLSPYDCDNVVCFISCFFFFLFLLLTVAYDCV